MIRTVGVHTMQGRAWRRLECETCRIVFSVPMWMLTNYCPKCRAKHYLPNEEIATC